MAQHTYHLHSRAVMVTFRVQEVEERWSKGLIPTKGKSWWRRAPQYILASLQTFHSLDIGKLHTVEKLIGSELLVRTQSLRLPILGELEFTGHAIWAQSWKEQMRGKGEPYPAIMLSCWEIKRARNDRANSDFGLLRSSNFGSIPLPSVWFANSLGIRNTYSTSAAMPLLLT